MTSTPNPDGFEESAELPTGRKSRTVSEALWRTLADSAKRGVAFTKSAAPGVIDELRKDLGTAAVRAKYVITQETEKVNDQLHKLKFSAVAKDEATSTPADAGKAAGKAASK